MFSLLLDHKIKARHHFKINVFANGSQFLADVNTHYDALILDYDLPDLNGLEVVKRLKSLKITTPVIIVSGQLDAKVTADLKKEGIYAYLPKDTKSLGELAGILDKLEEDKMKDSEGGIFKFLRKLFGKKQG